MIRNAERFLGGTNGAADLALAPTLIDQLDHVATVVRAQRLTPAEAARRYCLFLLIFPLLAIPACIRLGSSDFFMRHGASVWVQSNDAVFNMRDRDCDVLIFGDSTAMTGIDPAVVERNTGFKTCNISVTNAVLAVTHNLTLNHYMAQNAKPRVLLIQLSPDGFQPESNAWNQPRPEPSHPVYPSARGHRLCRICRWLQRLRAPQGCLVLHDEYAFGRGRSYYPQRILHSAGSSKYLL